MAFWYVALTSLLALLHCWSGTATSSVSSTTSNYSSVSFATVLSFPPSSTTTQGTVVMSDTDLQTIDITSVIDQSRASPSPQTQSMSNLDMTSDPKSPATVPSSASQFVDSTPDASNMDVSESVTVTDSIPDTNVTEAALSSSQPSSRSYITTDISTTMAFKASVFTIPVIIVISLGCVMVLMIFTSVIVVCLCTRHQPPPAIFREIGGSGENIIMSSIEAGDDHPKYGIDNPDMTTTDERPKTRVRENGAVQKASSKKSKEDVDDWNRWSQVSGVEYTEIDVEDALSAVDNIQDDQDGDETSGTGEEETRKKKEEANEMTTDATKDAAKEPQPRPSRSTQEVAANMPGSEPDTTNKDDGNKIADEKPAKEIQLEPIRRVPTLQDGVTTPHEENAGGLDPSRIPDQMPVTKAMDTTADNTATVN